MALTYGEWLETKPIPNTKLSFLIDKANKSTQLCKGLTKPKHIETCIFCSWSWEINHVSCWITIARRKHLKLSEIVSLYRHISKLTGSTEKQSWKTFHKHLARYHFSPGTEQAHPLQNSSPPRVSYWEITFSYGKPAPANAPGTSVQPQGNTPQIQKTSACHLPSRTLALPATPAIFFNLFLFFSFFEEGKFELCLAALYYSLHNCYVLLEIWSIITLNMVT